MSRKISQAGLKLIKNFEGCRLTAYKPVSTEKFWTIGWGHYGPDVKEGMTITQAQADSMLIADLAKYEAYVNNQAYVPVTKQLNQNQFDALVSFCYNCGAGNLRSLCKGRTVDQIAASITKYNKAGGEVLNGLVRRRQAELELFNQSGKGAEPVNDKVNVIVNDKQIQDGKLVDGVTYVPLRAVGEALGAQVGWDKGSKTATLSTKV
jgi:GH24 family phage-related lysozyme (muramidase)